MFSEDIIIYEQPLNEVLRTCLRLEYLLQQVTQYLRQETIWDSRIALAAILDILNILDRPDLKMKLVKAISQRILTLTALKQAPNVDSKKLNEVLKELDQLTLSLQNVPGKLGQKLRENEFLNAIRLHLAKPAGFSDFTMPVFHFWLQQLDEIRKRDLMNWFKELADVHKIGELLLQLTRETGKPQLKFAKHGFYQESLDSNIPYQMICVGIPKDRKVVPEISVGRYGLSIHFFSPNFEGRSIRVTHEIPFKLACCVS